MHWQGAAALPGQSRLLACIAWKNKSESGHAINTIRRARRSHFDFRFCINSTDPNGGIAKCVDGGSRSNWAAPPLNVLRQLWPCADSSGDYRHSDSAYYISRTSGNRGPGGLVSEAVHATFGASPREGDLTAFFSARLDETGTDGRSEFIVVAGAVAEPTQWDYCEAAWADLLRIRKVSAFHSKEYQQRDGHFAGWSDTKRRRFQKAQERIIRENTAFEVGVAVERRAHAQIKKDMRGIRGFKADSDYGMGFRIAMFQVCWFIGQHYPDAKVGFIVEDGPFAQDASAIYQSVSRMRSPRQPSHHAHMLGGFAFLPKGRLRSLEAADYLAGQVLEGMQSGALPARQQLLFLKADREFLDGWHKGMIAEKERRRLFHRRQRDGEG